MGDKMKRSHLAKTGTISNGFYKTITNSNDLPVSTQKKIKKIKASATDVRFGHPNFYQPLFQATNILLPRDRRERSEWCRHFYRTEPIVATALDLHTEFPISQFSHVCPEPKVKEFFDYLAFEKLDIINLLLNIGLEYWKIGDVFPFGQFNESTGEWERFTLLNPDYVNLSSSIFASEPIIELIPDDQVMNIIKAGPVGEFAELYHQFPEDVIRQVKLGKNIMLDNRLVSHIAHKASPYEMWGTPLIMRCFKTLIYKDKLRQAQDAIANRHIMPLRVAKIGTPGEAYPSQEEIEDFRDTLLMGEDDPNFFLIYHYGLSFEYVGSTGKILPLNTEFDFIKDELMTGLCITQAMLNGDGTAYANAQVGFDVLARRYMTYRMRLESWIRNKVYKPVAEVQGFYKHRSGIPLAGYTGKQLKKMASQKEVDLIIPKIAWQQQDLTSNNQIMSFLEKLTDAGMVSKASIYPMIGLDPEIEKRNLERERGTIFDPNAPKEGPLPNEGKRLIVPEDFETGTTLVENRPDLEENAPAPRPNPPQNNGLSIGNNPADFGFPEASQNHRKLKRHGYTLDKQINVSESDE